MALSRTTEVLSTPDRQAVREFLETNRPVGCARLSSALPDSTTVTTVAATHDSAIVGYAQSSPTDDGYTVDCVTDDPAARQQLITTLIAGLPAGAAVTWWGHELASDDALAASLHMAPPHRRLLNMRTTLPLAAAVAVATGGHEVAVRAFEVGRDEQAWLQVNNAAFSWHGEQGGWNLATLQMRIEEPWFDPAGFLLHERDGRLAAFCWTKVHPARVGEIYVIAVHPDFHGLGLGRALTITGLRHLSETGSTIGMLYVEADNTAAVRLYKSLGFHTTHTDIAFHRPGDTK